MYREKISLRLEVASYAVTIHVTVFYFIKILVLTMSLLMSTSLFLLSFHITNNYSVVFLRIISDLISFSTWYVMGYEVWIRIIKPDIDKNIQAFTQVTTFEFLLNGHMLSITSNIEWQR